jgi:hypothetical protein
MNNSGPVIYKSSSDDEQQQQPDALTVKRKRSPLFSTREREREK